MINHHRCGARLVCLMLGACSSSTNAPVDARGDLADPGCSLQPGWSGAPELPLGATQETAVVAVDGKIYVLGGFNASPAVLPAVQVFDTQTCTWSLGPELPGPVHHANAAVVGGTIYIVGALEGSSFTATGHVWSWSPSTESMWTIHPAMPAGTERGASIVGVIAGRIYVAGGLRGGSVATVSSFDPGTGTWDTTLAPLPQPRDHGCGGVVGNKLYVTGGRQTAITSPSPIVSEYTPGGTWIGKAPMPTGRGGTACGVIDERIIVVGGEGNGAASSGVFPNVESYQPALDSWQELAPMPTPRHGMGAAAWNGSLYVPGGASLQGFGAVATVEIFTP